MKKYFVGLCWDEEYKPCFHLKDYEFGLDEFIDIPQELLIERIDQKICIGTINPYTREYISCNNIIEDSSSQCNHCKYMFDFYKCVRCHGDDCSVKNGDVLKYCNTPHYVYLAYFPNGKIKVGTASEIKKYNRLLEQGAIFSIFIAKTPTGKIARQIEKNIIDNGITGAVTTTYKMKNIVFDSEEKLIRQQLIEKYKDILKLFAGDNKKYLIEPEFNSFNEIKDKIDNNMLSSNIQVNLFDEENKQIKPYIIKKELDRIFGAYLFCVGKVLAVENNGTIELIDTKKMEGYLFEFKNIKNLNTDREIKCLGGEMSIQKSMCPFCEEQKNRNISIVNKSRTLAETDNFVVFPTTGGFVKNYQLIVPKKHINCFGELSKEQLIELKSLILWQKQINRKYFNSNSSMFEHNLL